MCLACSAAMAFIHKLLVLHCSEMNMNLIWKLTKCVDEEGIAARKKTSNFVERSGRQSESEWLVIKRRTSIQAKLFSFLIKLCSDWLFFVLFLSKREVPEVWRKKKSRKRKWPKTTPCAESKPHFSVFVMPGKCKQTREKNDIFFGDLSPSSHHWVSGWITKECRL